MPVQDSHLAIGHAVEIIGKVDGNLKVKVQAATDFGTGIGTLAFLPSFHSQILADTSGPVADFEAANAVVEATHRHKEIFYDGD